MPMFRVEFFNLGLFFAGFSWLSEHSSSVDMIFFISFPKCCIAQTSTFLSNAYQNMSKLKFQITAIFPVHHTQEKTTLKHGVEICDLGCHNPMVGAGGWLQPPAPLSSPSHKPSRPACRCIWPDLNLFSDPITFIPDFIFWVDFFDH